jgi:uncharacterized iron-regulated membrane protein
MSLRQLLFWAHLIAGVAAGVVIAVLSTTGTLLTFQRQVVAWSVRGMQPASVSANSAPLSADALADTLRARGGALPNTLLFSREPGMPVAAEYDRGRVVYLDAYTAQSLGEAPARIREMYRFLTQWHVSLGRTGLGSGLAHFLISWSNILFVLLALSGLILWIPRPFTRQRVSAVAIPSFRLSPKARDFNWHNVSGLWFALPLILIGGTGVVLSFDRLSELMIRIGGETPRAPAVAPVAAGASAVSLDSLLSTVKRAYPGWYTIVTPMPSEDAAQAAMTVDESIGGRPQYRTALWLNRASGQIVSVRAFSDEGRGRRWRSFVRTAHTGEYFGVFGQLIAGIASFASVVLVATGLLLSWRRFGAWRRRRERDGAVSA